MTDGRLDIDAIRRSLATRRVGSQLMLIDETSSTNDFVWHRPAEQCRDGLVVFAEFQTQGRGRLGHEWLMPRGAGILCSLLVIPNGLYATPPGERISLISAVATAEAIATSKRLDARIEWPNDILIGERKVAGILVESRRLTTGVYGYVVGVGINCLQHRGHFPAALSDRATSLEIESTSAICREDVAIALLTCFDAWLTDPERWTDEAIRGAFAHFAVPFGRRIRLRHEGELFIGRVVDVDPTSAITLILDDGQRRVFPAAGSTVVRDEDVR